MRGFYIATGQYSSSSCVSAVVLTLGGDDMPDSEQVDCEREKVEVRDKEKETKRGSATHAQTRDIMDGM